MPILYVLHSVKVNAELGPPSLTIFNPKFTLSAKYILYSISGTRSLKIFAHDTITVVPWTKFWGDHFVLIWIEDDYVYEKF